MDIDETKRGLVEKEIVRKGYSPEDFETFLKQQKNTDEINLLNWPIEEIQSFIKKFQSEKQYQTQSQSQIINLNNEPPKNDQPKDDKFPSKGNYIKTRKPDPSPIFDQLLPPVWIEITKYKSVSNSFFSLSEFEFTIEIPQIYSKASRKLSEFKWLYNYLVLYFPNVYIPSLPDFPLLKRYTPEFLNKKVRFLNYFLELLIINPLIRTTKLFMDFVTLPEKEFEESRRDFDKCEPPAVLKKLFTIDEKIPIAIETEKEEEADKIEKTIKQRDKAIELVKIALKEVIDNFSVLALKFKKLASAFEEVKNAYKDNEVLKEIFRKYKKLFDVWGKNYEKQKEVFDCEYFEFYDYMQKYNNGLLKFYDESQEAKYKFMNEYLKYDKVGKLIPRDQKVLNRLRKDYGYKLNRLVNEYNVINNKITVECFDNQMKRLQKREEDFFQDYKMSQNLIQINLENRFN